jgi:hypothetical protein
MPTVFEAFDFSDARTDYLIWRKGTPSQPEVEIAADQLGVALLDAAGVRRGDTRS